MNCVAFKVLYSRSSTDRNVSAIVLCVYPVQPVPMLPDFGPVFNQENCAERVHPFFYIKLIGNCTELTSWVLLLSLLAKWSRYILFDICPRQRKWYYMLIKKYLHCDNWIIQISCFQNIFQIHVPHYCQEVSPKCKSNHFPILLNILQRLTFTWKTLAMLISKASTSWPCLPLSVHHPVLRLWQKQPLTCLSP